MLILYLKYLQILKLQSYRALSSLSVSLLYIHVLYTALHSTPCMRKEGQRPNIAGGAFYILPRAKYRRTGRAVRIW